MKKKYISISLVVFLILCVPSLHSQEKEGGEGHGEEHFQGVEGDRDGGEGGEAGDGEGEGGDRDGDEGGKEGDGADESTSPVIAWIKGEAQDSIAKIGWRLMREVDGKVIYEVQLRQRIEGKAGDWKHEAETAKTDILVDGLKPNTTYDVRVRGWIGGQAGRWIIRENAFKTSSEHGDGEGEDHEDGERDGDEEGEGGDGERDRDEDGDRERGSDDEGQVTGKPGEIKAGEVGEHSAVIWWSKPEQPKNAEFFYDVQLRKRINGKPTEWKHAVETARNEIVLKELASGTLYEVRVRGWVDNVAGPWQIKEHAFKTLGGDHNEGHGDGEGEGNREGNDGEGGEVGLRVAWVKGKAEARVAVLWWQLMGDAEGKLAYDVQLRPRIEGKAGEWEHAAETTHREVKVDGLKAGTDYDVRVRAWHEKKPGPWKVREYVFTTMGGEVDGGDSEPDGDGENENVGPVIAWIKAGASDKIAEIGWRLLREFDREVIYEVQIRERAGEEVGEWRHEAETAKRDIHVDGLHPNTTYDARVRAWLGDKPGEWKIREAAFRTKQTGKGDDQPDEGGEDGQVGVPEIAQIKADDIGPRAGVALWDLLHETDTKVGYDVQIRIRVEGKAGEWNHEAETAKNSIIIDGLKPDTLYEIRVRPWANKKAGEWKVLENAFRTRKGEEGDGGHGDGYDGEGEKGDGGDAGESPKAPGHPGMIKVSKVTPNSALIHWEASKVPGETKAVYDVQIRQRLAGKPTEWRYVGETFKTEFAVGKLEPGTLYEVRVRAWANKTSGPWQIKEHAFTTGGGEGGQTIDHAGHVGFQVIPGGKMRLTWPAGRGRFVVESTESIAGSSWATVDIRPVQISQVMVADLPIGETGMRFFRVRN